MATMTMMASLLAFRRPKAVLSLFLLLLLQAKYTLGQGCMPQPILLPIENVTLATGMQNRGVFLSVGQPQQKFAFLPNWHNNNTFLYGPGCDSVTIAGTGDECITYRGGVYQPGVSTTKGTVASAYAGASDPWPTSTYKFIADTLHMTTNIDLKDFIFANPINVTKWDLQAYDPLNIIGMDKNSTFLSTLQGTKLLQSSTFGWWWGLDGVEDADQQPGSFVLGGYDKAKTFGDGVTIPTSKRSDCPTGMMVTISDIILNGANGDNVSIFSKENGGTVLLACVIPERPSVMDMPRIPYFSNLLEAIDNEEASRSTGIDWWNVVLNGSESVYNGDMTFVIDNGLNIKVPNHQLVVPERKLDTDGRIITDPSRPVIRINSLQASTANVLPVLGRYFFTAAYLMGNPANNKFTIWQANPTTDTTLVAVDDSGATYDSSQFCDPAANTTSPASAGSSLGASSGGGSSSSSSKVSSGTIAGAAVGAAAGVAAVAGLAWFFLRRRRRRETAYQQAVNDTAENGPSPSKYPHEMQSPHQGVPQIYSPEPAPQEMATTENHDSVVEMPG